MKRSSTPASAKTSASPTVATVSPVAPAATCRAAIWGILCVFTCGRSRWPRAATVRASASMFRFRMSRSMRTAGVWRDAGRAGRRTIGSVPAIVGHAVVLFQAFAGGGVLPVDVRLEFRALHPPDAASADLDRREFAAAHQGAHLRHVHAQLYGDVFQAHESHIPKLAPVSVGFQSVAAGGDKLHRFAPVVPWRHDGPQDSTEGF